MKDLNFKARFLFVLFLLACLGSLNPAAAQTKYWVLLKDKKGVSFDPYQYFDQKAIERRQRQNLPLSDERDKPLNAAYVAQITGLTDSVSGASRWLNAVACFATPAQAAALQKLPFVSQVLRMPETGMVLAGVVSGKDDKLKPAETEILKNQTASLGAATFKAKGLDGKGVRIAVLDAGFKAVDKSPAFEHIRNEKRIVKTWDFVKKREYVYDHATHGTMVLSCIGGRQEGQDIGLATGAEFLLARTERMHSEKFSEEEFWLQAMEWADKNGADIINSSLGYTYHRYFQEQMDGKTSLISRATDIAFEKGILVVNAAGNDGSGEWKILGAPADGQHVLAVGGIDAKNFYKADFSSYGPTADKRLKPNVSAFGIVIAAGPKGLDRTQGTSFASPLVAGFAACAWQLDRKQTNAEIFSKVERSGHLYPYYDYAHGYGVPQAEQLFFGPESKIPPTVKAVREGDMMHLEIIPSPKTDSVMIANPDQLVSSAVKLPFKEYFYYHFTEPGSGVLNRYYVVEVGEGTRMASFNIKDRKPGSIVRVHYKGYTLELND